MAVTNAYRDLPAQHDWKYYKRTYQFQTEASVAYDDFTYDAETKIGTSATAWPANAAEGLVIISSNLYVVEERIDDYNIRFQATNAPQDVVEDVTWVRNSFPIPCVRRIASLLESPTNFSIASVSQEEVAEYLRLSPYPTQPNMFSVHGAGMHVSRMHLELAPPPLSARTYVLSGDMRPRDLLVHRDKFFVSADGVTVTPQDERKFNSRHVGSILRFSEDGKEPTGQYGSDGQYNPYLLQRTITAVDVLGVATIDESLPSAITQATVIASDPLDIDTEVMLNYFDALAARKLSEMTLNQTDRGDLINLERQALRLAVGADSRVKAGYHRNWYGAYNFAQTMRFPVSGTVVQ